MSTIEITTNIGCNLACKFCPQDKISKVYKRGPSRMLNFEDYKTIVDKIPKDVRIDFSGYSEPFLNTECLRMIDYAINNAHSVALYTTLQGMSCDDARQLLNYLKNGSLLYVVLHLPDLEGNMPGLRYTETYFECLSILLPHGNVSTMTMSKTNRISEEVSRYVNAELKTYSKKLPKSRYGQGFLGWSRAGSLNANKVDGTALLPSVRWNVPISCNTTPFYDHNVVVPNGNVHLCTMDYGGKHILGNLLESDYESLFESKQYLKILAENKKNYFSSDSICRVCEDVVCHKFDNQTSNWAEYRPGHVEVQFQRYLNDKQRAIKFTKAYRDFGMFIKSFKCLFKK